VTGEVNTSSDTIRVSKRKKRPSAAGGMEGKGNRFERLLKSGKMGILNPPPHYSF